jgi:ABC-2 type transport system ATP-binding protein
VTPGKAIEVRALTKCFGPQEVVKGLDLDVERGECFGLLGTNGAGKTTTLEILEGLQEATSGEVRLLGLSWARNGKELRERIGVQLQETLLHPLMSVEETLALFRSFYRSGPSVEELLELLGLTERRKARVGVLSGGQRQRVALATALVSSPDILFLDEPTTGLDPASRRALWEVIRRLKARGCTILLTTHYVEEAEQLCDRVAFLDQGRITALDRPEALVAAHRAEQIIELQAVPMPTGAEFEALEGVLGAQPAGESVRLLVREGGPVVSALLAMLATRGCRIEHLWMRRATLEDVFLAAVERGTKEAA